jgi:hypothetical protein
LSATREGLGGAEVVEDAKKTGGRAAGVKGIGAVVAMICSKENGWVTSSMISTNGVMIFAL